MKVEKISDTSLEIFLTKEDLQNKNINIDDLLEGDVKAQDILYDLMNEVEKDYDITIESTGLFKMHVLNHTNGDISLIISTFSMNDDKVDLYKQLYKQLEQNLPAYNNMLSKYSAKDIEKKIQQKMSFLSKDNKALSMIYAFEKLDDIKSSLDSININFKNEIIYKFKSKYYLVLYLKASSSKKKVESLFNEFATLVSQQHFEAILQEHGEIIIKENAKNILELYF